MASGSDEPSLTSSPYILADSRGTGQALAGAAGRNNLPIHFLYYSNQSCFLRSRPYAQPRHGEHSHRERCGTVDIRTSPAALEFEDASIVDDDNDRVLTAGESATVLSPKLGAA